MTRVHLNGRLVEAAEARIDPADRGFLLADGLFETLRAYGGRPFRLPEHLARPAAGAATLELPMPPGAEIAAAVGETLAANGFAEASIRITLTQGPGPRGLLPPREAKPTLLVAAHSLPASQPAPVSACLAGARRNEHSPLSRLKTLGYLDNVLALREAAAAGFDEAILLNTAGRIAGGSRSNLFLVLEGVVATPPASEGVLPGIARQTVLELARAEGIPLEERALPASDLERAEEVFLTNSLIEVAPLAALGRRRLPSRQTGETLAGLYRKAIDACSAD